MKIKETEQYKKITESLSSNNIQKNTISITPNFHKTNNIRKTKSNCSGCSRNRRKKR